MRLIIAEKPSLARAIAAVLPNPQKRGDRIECADGTTVAWCAGHILELAPPDAYDPAYKQWALEHLPIVPREWRNTVTSPDLLKTLKGLVAAADEIVHAGDPDREGQLLVEEVLEYLGHRGSVQRLLVSDLNPPAVRKALGALRPNRDFRGQYESALGRQRADWLYGLNLTRLYTLLGRAAQYDGVLSVGRVQTPVLGLIVRRDLEIEGFTAKPYFTVVATVTAGDGAFGASWVPGEQQGGLDSEGRLVDRAVAADVQRRTRRQPGVVRTATRERKSAGPPLPFSLARLQAVAGRRLGLTAKQVLDACQALYETHRLTTYPRSDCSYLPVAHLEDAGQVLAAIGENAPALRDSLAGVDRARRSRAWDDTKVTAHHAIIPTPTLRRDAKLSATEEAIYELIARQYVAQFYAPEEYEVAVVEVDVAGELFRATGRVTISDGWRVLFHGAGDASAAEGADDEQNDPPQRLPPLSVGAPVVAADVAVNDKQTQPPRRFTDATLIQAMTGIARYVSDPRVKQVLRETDGIGTPATQAQIIETLFERDYVRRDGRNIVSTATGRALIGALPPLATTPDMTALWEVALRRVAEGTLPLADFLSGVLRQLEGLIAQGRAAGRLEVPHAHPCPRSGCAGHLRRRKGSKGFFWSCSAYKDGCTVTMDDVRGSPRAPRKSTATGRTRGRPSRGLGRGR